MPQPLINITRRQAYIFAFFLVLYEFLTYIANDMIMPGMIQVVASFHASASAIGTSFTLYVLGGASLQLFLGPLSDCYGRRPVMLFGAFFFFLFTVLIAISHSMGEFLAARFFQGMGLCFISVIGYATVQEIFAEMDAVRLIAIMANLSVTAPLLGPLAGALLINHISWRGIFVVIAIAALGALWGLWRYMPEPVGQVKRNGEHIKSISLAPRVILSNYKQLLCNRSFMLGSIALGLISTPSAAWIALSPVILVLDAHVSLLEYGLWQIPVFGAYILGNVGLQWMTHRFSIKTLSWIGSMCSVTGLFGVLILPWLMGWHYLWIMPGLMVYFLGCGLGGAPLNRYVLYSTPVGKGTASAVLSLILMAILGFGTQVINLVSHTILGFGVSCALIGLVYLVFLSGAFFEKKV
jgi:DHA1 family multidrug/chloramphenicol efflux transport protein-like MFS transporter